MRIRAKHQDVWLVRPGDHVALIYKERLSDEERHHIGEGFTKAWPDIHVVILEGDWDMKVLRPEDANADPPVLDVTSMSSTKPEFIPLANVKLNTWEPDEEGA